MSLGRKHLNFDHVFTQFMTSISLLFNPPPPPQVQMNHDIVVHHSVSGMDLYQLVYNMCNILPNPMHEELFLRLATFLTQHCARLAESIHTSPSPLLLYAKHWATYLHAVQTLNIVCDVLNRAIVAPLRGIPSMVEIRPLVRDSMFRRQSIDSLAFLIWKDTVFSRLCQQLIRAVLDVIRMDREDVLGPHEACKALALSLVTLQAKSTPSLTLYVSEYEHAILNETRLYYQTESRLAARDYHTCKFMRMAQIRLDQELIRAKRYLHPSSIDKLVYECNIQYIANHKNKIQDSFDELLSSNSCDDLQLAYLLLSRIPNGIDLLTQVYEKHIIRQGRNLISPDPKTMTFALSNLHAQQTSDIHTRFMGDTKFVASMDMAFRTIVNDTSYAAKMLAQYTDWLLRKVNKQSDLAVEQGVNAVMTVFTYVDDKDVFHNHYARLLARRLIHSLSASDELEYLVLQRLKVAQGVEYTSKLQRMFTDVSVSDDVSSAFRELCRVKPDAVQLLHSKLPLSIKVLTAGTWPMSPSNVPVLAHLPEEIAESVTLFTEYYMSKHSGRKLFWMWNLCRVDVKFVYGYNNRYEVNMSLHQWALLSLFNDPRDELINITKHEISQALGIPATDVESIAKSLVDAGFLSDTKDGIRLNTQYSSKRTKVRLGPIPLDGQKHVSGTSGFTSNGDESTDVVDDNDRQLYMQATLVRLMKTYQRMDHTQLVSMAIDASRMRFVPKPPFVKKCIELLLDKGYIERDTSGVECYLYVA